MQVLQDTIYNPLKANGDYSLLIQYVVEQAFSRYPEEYSRHYNAYAVQGIKRNGSQSADQAHRNAVHACIG